MSYEAQIAGLGDAPPGRPLYGRALRRRSSGGRCASCWPAAAAAVAGGPPARRPRVRQRRRHRQHGRHRGRPGRHRADRRLRASTARPCSTPTGPGARPRPRYFATSVVRRPGPGLVTVHGGGWIASGPAEPSRLPEPVAAGRPALLRTEGAGEVQTPLSGRRPTRCGRATGSGSATPRPASSASTWTRCTWSAATRSTAPCPTYRGEHAPAFLYLAVGRLLDGARRAATHLAVEVVADDLLGLGEHLLVAVGVAPERELDQGVGHLHRDRERERQTRLVGHAEAAHQQPGRAARR